MPYHCWASVSEEYDSCTGAVAGWRAIDTSTPGPSFTVNGTDANNGPLTKTVNYTVVDPASPVANAGTPQSGKVAGKRGHAGRLGLDRLEPGFVDLHRRDGPHPTGPNTFTWTQTGGPR